MYQMKIISWEKKLPDKVQLIVVNFLHSYY